MSTARAAVWAAAALKVREASEEAAALAAAAAKTVFERATADGNGALEASAAAEVPDDYVCPISAAVMIDPVSTLDGFTYERKAITEWLRTKDNLAEDGRQAGEQDAHPEPQPSQCHPQLRRGVGGATATCSLTVGAWIQ